MPNDTGGPYLVAALICERVLHEADGVNSIIRVIDRFTIEGGKEAPGGLDDKHVASLDFSLYVSLKNGRAAGNHRLKVVPVRPDMSNPEPFEQVVHLESGEERGVNIVFPTKLLASMPGVYWFEVYLDGQLMTKTPLNIVYIPPAGGRS
mgnify:CR=1 FL=1